MVRILGFLVGLGFCGVAAWSLLWGAISYIQEPPEKPAEYAFHEEPHQPLQPYSFSGPFGRFDNQQLQRGFQVYREVCAACHGLHYVAFRNLSEIGYSEAEVRAIAAQWPIEVPTVNEATGEPATRPAIPSDRFPEPYANEVAARAANSNAFPPDLSLIVKAREGGAPYLESLLTGYREPPADLPESARPGVGLHYNPYFANLNLAMPPPITADGQVTYAPGNPAPTRQQMAHDVAAFLAWAAEPRMDERKNMGLVVLIFLLFATVLAYLSYQNIWHAKKHEGE